MCVPAVTTSEIYKTLLGNKADTWNLGSGQFITTDGMFYAIRNSPDTYLHVIYITVDVNGYGKGPNVYGRDVFMFQLLNDNLVPMGSKGTDYSSNGYCKNSSGTYGYAGYIGLGCMEYVMEGKDY